MYCIYDYIRNREKDNTVHLFLQINTVKEND